MTMRIYYDDEFAFVKEFHIFLQKLSTLHRNKREIVIREIVYTQRDIKTSILALIYVALRCL